MRIGIVLPHIFMHKDIINHVIFSPGSVAIDLITELANLGNEVYFFTPKYELIDTSSSNTSNISRNKRKVKAGKVININADLSFFEEELKLRGDTYISLLEKHPLTFITLARQVQAELVAKAYEMANTSMFDILHIFANEEELALAFAKFCNIPTFFTHHEPFNFLTKYRSQFSKYRDLNWVSLSYAQRKTLKIKMNFVGNVYNGLRIDKFIPLKNPSLDYVAYSGRIIEPKGVHIAIEAAIKAGVKLKIAGKHYADSGRDTYFEQKIKPFLNNPLVEFIGFLKTDKEKNDFYGNAKALIVPSTWEEPFGMVIIEALASGTPVIGLNTGAIPEVINNGVTGCVVKNDRDSVLNISKAIKRIGKIKRSVCRKEFEKNFTSEIMAKEYLKIYSLYL